jgi:hypothetical protein
MTFGANEFKKRTFQLMERQTFNQITDTYEEVSTKTDTHLLDDEKYDWKYYMLRGEDEKYSRYAICSKSCSWRGLTMGEFYGTGIVD